MSFRPSTTKMTEQYPMTGAPFGYRLPYTQANYQSYYEPTTAHTSEPFNSGYPMQRSYIPQTSAFAKTDLFIPNWHKLPYLDQYPTATKFASYGVEAAVGGVALHQAQLALSGYLQ